MVERSCTHEELISIYNEIKDRVSSQINTFDNILINKNKDGFVSEFIFCLLTPQSKAREAHKAVTNLFSNDLVYSGTLDQIKPFLRSIRFFNNKASYIIKNRPLYTSEDFYRSVADPDQCNRDIREYLVKNVIGYGYKEASHFLRNIGRGNNIAILDRHILRGMCELGCICEMPKTMSRNYYMDIEDKVLKLSKGLKMDVRYLDFVLWYRKTKDIFK